MHLACSLSATSTLALTIIPWLNSIFGVMGIQWWQYGFSIGLGLRRFVLPKSEQTKAKERAKAEPVVAEAPVCWPSREVTHAPQNRHLKRQRWRRAAARSPRPIRCGACLT
eukprot:Polyplicarium_translucidae@DN2218_c0_g1_i2.p1